MSYIARKITRAKWEPKEGLAEDEIPADAITVDLRTADNCLSFWQCETASAGELDLVALAITSAGQRIDRIDIVWLPARGLVEDGVDLLATEGRTAYRAMVKEHRDATALDLERLSRVAIQVAQAIREGRHKRFRRGQVEAILRDAMGKGLLEPSSLSDDLREAIEPPGTSR